MSHDELKTLLNTEFGKMFQIMTSQEPDVQLAQSILDELVNTILESK
jgi:hypothetical protein